MKLKHFSFLSTLLLLLAACDKTPTGYTVSGTAEGTVDGDTVYICEMQGYFNMIPTDTAVVKDGKFEFKGEIDGASIRYLIPTHKGEQTTLAMFMLENADIKATLIKGDESEDHKNVIESGPNGKLFEEYSKVTNKIEEESSEPWNIANDSTKTEAERQAAQATLDSLRKVRIAFDKKFIIDHVPSALSDLLFGYRGEDFTKEEQEEILKLFGEKQPDFPFYKSIMAQREAEKSTAIGSTYTDLQQEGPDGKTVKVSDYVGKNKYVLIDFWASWCGPCRQEMPTVVEAYTRFHDKGFEVVGVSLDNEKDAWVKAIEKLQMPWPQMSDLKGWDNKAAAAYNVRAIPANVLIDADGKIIAKDLRGEELLSKMAELLP